jgi:hypothetical protein
MILSITATVVPPAFAAGSQPDVNFKIYSPGDSSSESKDAAPADNGAAAQPAETPATPAVTTAAPAEGAAESSAETKTPAAADSTPAADASSAEPAADKTDAQGQKIASKVLQGYIRVVPSGTKIPIIMDTAVDSDTSQEGDEFSARTSEDLTIDGGIVVPAGSVIKGRIAQLNAAKRFDRSGSVALKFDSVTTPDNKQIPIVANIVARGGVVHAKRGMKDIAIETGMVTLPTAAGLGIGLLAGNASKSSSIGAAGGAVIGAAVGVAVGVIILCAKKGKRVDVRPGDELKIELAEDLRMPM